MSVKVSCWKDKMFVNGDFPSLRKLSIELPGYKKFVGDALLIESSAKNIEHLLLLESIEWKDDAKAIAEGHTTRLAREAVVLQMKDSSEATAEDNFPFKTKPFIHQNKAFFLSKDAEYYAYFMEMGTGKTKVLIDNAAYLFLKKEINCLVILAPKGVHAQWINEQIPIHMSMAIGYEAEVFRAGNKKLLDRIELLVKKKTDKLKIISFNIDTISNKNGLKLVQKFLNNNSCMLAMDESTRIKTPGSLRTKAAISLALLAKYRRIMSGAPITKGYEDLYPQLKFLHPDVLGFNSFYTFRNYYCLMGGFESRQIVGYRSDSIKELEERMQAYSFRVTKAECLDLPEKIYVTRYVELTQQQLDLYKKIEKELAIDIRALSVIKTKNPDEKKEVDPGLMSAITKMIRLQQIVCGTFVYEEEEKREIIDIENNRIGALMECVNEAQGKIIIWSRFVPDLKKISAELKKDKINHVTYYGEVSAKNRELAIEAFVNDPSCRVFLSNPSAGGTGLNLQVATTVIYYSNDFNADTRWQSEDRAHRAGQKNNVTYIDFISPKTIDEDILESLKNKKNVADALLDNPRKLIKYE